MEKALTKKDMTFFEIKSPRDIDAAYDVMVEFYKANKEKAPSRASQLDCTKRAQKMGYKYLGCRVQDKIVAIAGLRLMPDPYGPQLYAFLNNFIVAKKFRTLGIGTQMMDYCLKLAKQQQVKFLLLNVDKQNKAARNLYKFDGFKDAGLCMQRIMV